MVACDNNHKSKILSFGWVVDINKWLKKWDMEELLGVSRHEIYNYQGKLIESLMKKWEDAIRKKLEYYIANFNLECWVQYNTRMPIDHISLSHY